jgi:hypothetical protein
MGAKRMAVLSRYDAGEFPPEIVLGCFYDDTQVQERIRFVGSQPLATVRTGADGRMCSAGDRTVARRSLAASAQWFYLQAVSVLFQNGESASSEVPEILNEIVRISYLFTNPGLGSMSLENLIAYESENSVERVRRIEALVQRADWDLLYASDLGTRFVQSARETYEQAYQEAVEHGVADESMKQIFSPAIPVVLPSFMANPLVSERTPQSKGYIDVSFVVTEDGKSKQIEVLDTSTPDVSRDAKKDLVRVIKFSRFRPQVTDGQFMDSAPIVVRYYVNE